MDLTWSVRAVVSDGDVTSGDAIEQYDDEQTADFIHDAVVDDVAMQLGVSAGEVTVTVVAT